MCFHLGSLNDWCACTTEKKYSISVTTISKNQDYVFVKSESVTLGQLNVSERQKLKWKRRLDNFKNSELHQVKHKTVFVLLVGRSVCQYTLPPKSLATLDGEIVDPAIAVKLQMRDVLKVHGAQT